MALLSDLRFSVANLGCMFDASKKAFFESQNKRYDMNWNTRIEEVEKEFVCTLLSFWLCGLIS